jgi:hypothetical protein
MFITVAVDRMVDRWAVGSQQTARRNAMIASTALTQRRAERDEVEEFLASLTQATLTQATGTSSTHIATAHAAHG